MQLAEQPTPDNIAETAQRVRRTAIDRLIRHKRETNLFTYDGTILDQLGLCFVRDVWRPNDYRIMCSIRPCMAPQLQAEVIRFAHAHSLTVAGYDDDCVVDHDNGSFLSVECTNVSKPIADYLAGSDGLLVACSLLNDRSRASFDSINSQSNHFRFPHGSELAHGTDWRTLFLFDGLYPFDVVVAYLCFVSADLESYHVPACYLACYNETQLDRVRMLIAAHKTDIVNSIGEFSLDL